ncbi:putative holin [Acidovorax sp. SUPP3434]|uniref:putative holin n=1 Tax=Acidovorax sp. SUPP3434 TaxID=2920880 RepID=UPI0032EA26F3
MAVLLLALIALVSLAQLPVVLYKAALIVLTAVLGYWLDRVLSSTRPDGFLYQD